MKLCDFDVGLDKPLFLIAGISAFVAAFSAAVAVVVLRKKKSK